MSGTTNDDVLSRSLATSSTLLLKMGSFLILLYLSYGYCFILKGEMCKSCRSIEIENEIDEINNQWTISFEQFDAGMNAETPLVIWFESTCENKLSLEKRINNYHQDILR